MPHALSPRPWHLLPVALVLVLWHGALAFDYLNLRFGLFTATPVLMADLPLEALWLKVAWGMAVWLGLLGAFFLLISDDASVLLMFAAAVAMLLTLAGIATGTGVEAMSGPLAMLGWPGLVAGLALVPLLGWLYARWLKRQAVLH